MREQRGALPARAAPLLPAYAGVAALVLALALIVTLGADHLPAIIARDNYTLLISSGVGPTVLLFNTVALIALWRAIGRTGSVTQLWLLNAALASTLDVAITLAAGARYSFGWYAARMTSLLCASAVLGAFLYEFYRLQVSLSAANQRLTALADTDGLTNLGNRRAFDRRLAEEWARGARSGEPLALLVLDVDQFKLYNDNHGHQGGDECLRAVAGAIAGAVRRPSDFAARYGGEEMALLLPNTNREGALHVAEKLRAAIQALNIAHPTSKHGVVTASIGVAAEIPDAVETGRRLVAYADEALYKAKNGGRNRVEG